MLARPRLDGVRISAHSRAVTRGFTMVKRPAQVCHEIRMKIAEVCSSPVFVAYADQALAAAAREMRARDVGALVVVAAGDPRQCPLGILTDRDIVLGQVSQATDLQCLTVGDVMTHHPLCVQADTEITEAMALLASRGVRRAPVVDRSGALVGIVTLDDLLPPIAQQLTPLAETVTPEPMAHARLPQEGRAPHTAD